MEAAGVNANKLSPYMLMNLPSKHAQNNAFLKPVETINNKKETKKRNLYFTGSLTILIGTIAGIIIKRKMDVHSAGEFWAKLCQN